MIIALAGGVGGAKLAQGLAAVLSPKDLKIIVNTGDDFTHMGLFISPDIDTVTYTLAGLNNKELGWGLTGETWYFMDALERLGGDTWFRLGDQDLATHIERTKRLKDQNLSQITADFCQRLGVKHPVIPMTDDSVQTVVETDIGTLPFQEYFVQHQCQPKFKSVRYEGIEKARPHPEFLAALADPELEAVILCPSNPLLSLRPILGIPGVTNALAKCTAPIVAVSPFIGGKAVKGPAAKIMTELNLPITPAGLISLYDDLLEDGLLDGLVIDTADVDQTDKLERPVIHAANTLMNSLEDSKRLAEQVLEFAAKVKRS
ncbi:MAG: 2-phospho-L-lactate transferase [Emcibacter sp.]|nr:2-phospho-L-lactate transferase [Emcibacter sp.]